MNISRKRSTRWKTRLLVGWFVLIVSVVVFSDERIRSYFIPVPPRLPQHDAELMIYSPQKFFYEPLAPITEFPIVSIDEASKSIREDELVLGAIVNGETRAYPIKMLCGVKREVLNDHLGDAAIAVTWCHLGHNGVIYSRELGDQELVLQASDKFWRRSLLIQDQTGSVWSLLMGRCMEGEHEGSELKQQIGLVTDFKTWRETYPQSTVMVWPQDFQETYLYDRKFYSRVEKMLIDFSAGIVIRRMAKHYPFTRLRSHPLINDVHQGKPIVVKFDNNSSTVWCYLRELDHQVLEFNDSNGQIKDEQTGSTWDFNRGIATQGVFKGKSLEAIPTITSFTATWTRFHTKSEEWTPNSAAAKISSLD